MKNNNNKRYRFIFAALLSCFFSSVAVSQANNKNDVMDEKFINTTSSVIASIKPVAPKSIAPTPATSKPITPTSVTSISTLTQTKPPHQLTNYGASITEMLFYLMLVVGLIFFLAWLVKKVGYNNASQNHLMKVTACLPLTTKEKLMVVQIGEEQIVIGVAPGFVGHITALKSPMDSSDTDSIMNHSVISDTHAGTKKIDESNSNSFSTMLAKILKGQVQDEK
jgi:flagellar protein FliO/FliZ